MRLCGQTAPVRHWRTLPVTLTPPAKAAMLEAWVRVAWQGWTLQVHLFAL